jgi:hypothetical protein
METMWLHNCTVIQSVSWCHEVASLSQDERSSPGTDARTVCRGKNCHVTVWCNVWSCVLRCQLFIETQIYLADLTTGHQVYWLILLGCIVISGLDGTGIEFRCRRDFPCPSRPALRIIRLFVEWIPGLSRGLALITHSHVAPRLKKE